MATWSVTARSTSSRPSSGELHERAPAIVGVVAPFDPTGRLQPIDSIGHAGGGEHEHAGEIGGLHDERVAAAAEGGEDVELADLQSVAGEDLGDRAGRKGVQPSESADGGHRLEFEVGAFACPLLDEAVDVVRSSGAAMGPVLLLSQIS